MADIAKSWIFASSSGSNTYETLQYTDGSTSCNCFGWCRRVDASGNRSCKHTRSVDMGTADTEATSFKDYQTQTSRRAPAAAAKPAKAKSRKQAYEEPDAPTAIVRKIQW